MIKKAILLIIKLGISIVILFALMILLSNFVVEKSAADDLYISTSDIPKNKVGLVLGTAKYVRRGQINLYYKYRIEAATTLYKSGKVDFILISGDNSRKEYDEPSTMKEDLVEMGIPSEKIYLDYAGFRTLDSVVRCKEIFGQHSITVISQKLHNERAIFIAKRKGIEAVGFNAHDVG